MQPHYCAVIFKVVLSVRQDADAVPLGLCRLACTGGGVMRTGTVHRVHVGHESPKPESYHQGLLDGGASRVGWLQNRLQSVSWGDVRSLSCFLIAAVGVPCIVITVALYALNCKR